jgi:phosphate transport system permease protein
MTMAVTERLSRRQDTPSSGERLATRGLGRYVLPLTVVVVVAVMAGVFALTSLSGVPGFVALSGFGYLLAQTALSVAVEGRRRALDRLWTALVYLAFVAASLPLLLICWYTIQRGIGMVDLTFLTHSMFRVNPQDPGGGVYHAIVGTLIQALLATALATPLGILTSIYLVEYGGGRRFARLVNFFVDVMTGVPSIVVGLFVFTAWILVLGFHKSGLAGAFALAIVMLPMVVRSAEQMLRLVPDDLREAAYALGIAKWRTIISVVLPTALGGIVTGVMLGVARVAGETAPLLLLVGINQRIELNPFAGHAAQRPQETLPTLIFEQFGVAAGNTAAPPFERAWSAALVLIVLIGLLNLLARLIARLARIRG